MGNDERKKGQRRSDEELSQPELEQSVMGNCGRQLNRLRGKGARKRVMDYLSSLAAAMDSDEEDDAVGAALEAGE
jgi:hypothetical protein